jgi:hypothetical protein
MQCDARHGSGVTRERRERAIAVSFVREGINPRNRFPLVLGSTLELDNDLRLSRCLTHVL